MVNQEFLDLKKQVESLNVQQSTLSKLQHKAIFWQTHLRSQSIELEFSILLSDLEPELAESNIGPHGHDRTCYELSWKKTNSHFEFIVTNIKAKKSMSLVKCPEYLLDIILTNMDAYFAKMEIYLLENSIIEELAQTDSESEDQEGL